MYGYLTTFMYRPSRNSVSFNLLEPYGPVQAWNGMILPFYTLRFYFHLCQHQPHYFFPSGFPMTIIYTFLLMLDPFYLLCPDHPDAIFGKNTKFRILIIQLSQASFSSVTLTFWTSCRAAEQFHIHAK